MQPEWQTVQTPDQTVFVLKEQSDLGLHCLLRPICPTVKAFNATTMSQQQIYLDL